MDQDVVHASPAPNAQRDETGTLSLTLEQLSLSSASQLQYQIPSPIRHDSARLSPSPRSAIPRSSSSTGATSPKPLGRQPSAISNGQASLSPILQRNASTSSAQSVAQPTSPGTPGSRQPPGGSLFRSPSAVATSTVLKPPPATAATIASSYLAKELALHEAADAKTETVVILHDACYGHRYSRPRTTKGTLSLIVERPERIQACVMGVSAAYVRLGSRYVGSPHAPRPGNEPNGRLPFRIRKSSRALSIRSPAVTAVHGTKWMEELHIMCGNAGSRLANNDKELARPAHPGGDAAEDYRPTLHEGDLYLCPESLDAFQGALGGVCDAVDAIFSSPTGPSRAFVAVRPPGHHCSADFPSGFCWLNNVHVGIEYAAQTYGLTHAAILDFDLHHGDGSQDITWDRNAKSSAMPKNTPFNKKVSIGYYSLHDINSYPCEWGDKEKVQNASLCIDNAHGQSIWNVHLQPWTTDAEFWQLYEDRYSILLEKARHFLRLHTATIRATPKAMPPKSAIFISAGFDASEWEGAGMQRHKVNVPTQFYARFTEDVVMLAHEEGLAAEGRVISVLEGGYSDRALTSGLLSHLSGLCQKPQAAPVFSLGSSHHVSLMSSNGNGHESGIAAGDGQVRKYDPMWWHANQLGALEGYSVLAPPPPAAAKKARNGMLPTYSTPTESFTHKVVDPERFHRTIPGTMRPMPESPLPKVEPSALEVTWIIATHELSKLLIPGDRHTGSCKAEELAAPRIKKEKPALNEALLLEQSGGPRQLRDRKAKMPELTEPLSDNETGPGQSTVSQAARRRTTSDLSIPAATALVAAPVSQRTTRRSSNFSSQDSSVSGHEVAPSVPRIPNQHKPSTVQGMPPPQQIAKMRKTRAPRTPVAVSPASKGAGTVPLASQIQGPGPLPVQNVEARQAMPVTPEAQTTEPDNVQDMDRLTSAVKRITLKVGTREEHDRRQREREEAEKAQAEAKKKPRKVGVSRAKKEGSATPETVSELSRTSSQQGGRPQGSAVPAVMEASLPPPAPREPTMPALAAIQLDGSAAKPSQVRVVTSTLTSRTATSPVANSGPSTQETTDFAPPGVRRSEEPKEAPSSTASFSYANFRPLVPPSRDAPSNYTPVPDSAARPSQSDYRATQQPLSQTYRQPFASKQPFGAPAAGYGPAGRLPVWNSTGAIPFGTAPTMGQTAGQVQAGVSVPQWDGNGLLRLGPGSLDESSGTALGARGGADVLEAPETPQK